MISGKSATASPLRTLSSAQIQLLDNYYAQITRPFSARLKKGERASTRRD
jgi:hypothetical protein